MGIATGSWLLWEWMMWGAVLKKSHGSKRQKFESQIFKDT